MAFGAKGAHAPPSSCGSRSCSHATTPTRTASGLSPLTPQTTLSLGRAPPNMPATPVAKTSTAITRPPLIATGYGETQRYKVRMPCMHATHKFGTAGTLSFRHNPQWSSSGPRHAFPGFSQVRRPARANHLRCGTEPESADVLAHSPGLPSLCARAGLSIHLNLNFSARGAMVF